MNPNDYPWMNRGGMVGFEHHGGPGPLGWTIFALELLLVLGIAVLLVQAFSGRRRHRGPGAFAFAGRPRGLGDPLEVLRFRYARGELTRDEYLQAASDLGAEEAPTVEQPPPAA